LYIFFSISIGLIYFNHLGIFLDWICFYFFNKLKWNYELINQFPPAQGLHKEKPKTKYTKYKPEAPKTAKNPK